MTAGVLDGPTNADTHAHTDADTETDEDIDAPGPSNRSSFFPGHQQDVVHGLGTASQMPKSMNVALERATHAPAAAIPLFFGTNLLQTLEAAAQTTVS